MRLEKQNSLYTFLLFMINFFFEKMKGTVYTRGDKKITLLTSQSLGDISPISATFTVVDPQALCTTVTG